MKPGLQVGDQGRLDWTVDPTMVITLGGDPRATVFSTPNMILLMERAGREAIRPYLEAGEESVGIDVHIEHVAGAGLGAQVTGLATVSRVDGRRIGFDVQAICGERVLGHGSHTRAIVQLDRLIENLESASGFERRPMTLAANTGTLPSFQTLSVERDGPIAIVTLNRPQSLNAVNTVMTSELESVSQWLSGHPNEVRVVLLRGQGDAFCAGDDIKELPQLSESVARQLSLRQAELYLSWERLPQTVIALIHGDAFGGGCVMAYSTDLRIATHDARFAMPEIRLGWPPGYGIAQLTALVGKARALELCMLGEPISAQRALEWGLVHDVVPGAMLMKRARQIAEKLLQQPAEALRWTKRLVHLDEGMQPKVAYRADTEAYIRCLQSDDAREGIRAFVEKRPPKYPGQS